MLIPPPFPDDQRETTYQAALLLVSIIDNQLTLAHRHFYDAGGKLLLTLDQVVHAILEDRLLPPETR